MPSPDQIAEMQNAEVLKEFLADVKTTEIGDRLQAARRRLEEKVEQATGTPANVFHVSETKQMRKDLDAVIQAIKYSKRQSAERTLALRKIQEGVMWLGMDLKAMNEANPYPSSYEPTSPTIEPTADGLKL
jgi:hypothetical protein